jgi:hypothetical protein
MVATTYKDLLATKSTYLVATKLTYSVASRFSDQHVWWLPDLVILLQVGNLCWSIWFYFFSIWTFLHCIWSYMLLKDVLEILPLSMPKTFIDQFVFVWGCAQCITITGPLTHFVYYYLKDLNWIHLAWRGLLYGDRVKHYSLMMNLTRPFEIQNGGNFSLSHSKDVNYHYYQSGVQFTSLNHYGTLKVKISVYFTDFTLVKVISL